MNLDEIRRQLQLSADIQLALLQTEAEQIEQLAQMMIETFEGGGWVFLFGNGGSASDAEHIAAELVGRYLIERRPLPAMALSTNTSTLTAIGNDYGYESIFSRQLEAYCSDADMAIGISTSGSSRNVLGGLRTAARIGARTAGLTGDHPGRLAQCCDLCIAVPSSETPRIQESHIVIGHILCEYVERHFFG